MLRKVCFETNSAGEAVEGLFRSLAGAAPRMVWRLGGKHLLTDIRSWFGLVEQVSYAFSKSAHMHPFRELLRKGRKFYWDQQLTDLFKKTRVTVTELVKDGVKHFELGRATMLTTDWSKTGIGYVLQQKHCSCTMEKAPHCGPDHWKTILVGSRFLTDAETRYAPVEGEALALVYGLESTSE